MTTREQALEHWLHHELGFGDCRIEPASSDASFRRYFRVFHDGSRHIVMDAPPTHEDCGPFIAVAGLLHAVGVNVPQVIERDLAQGFLLLTDLGSTSYLDALDEHSVDRLYGDALGALAAIQGCAEHRQLPPYDRALLEREMRLFPDWLIGTHCGIELDPSGRQALEAVFEYLIESALEQPRVCVHRDYHSRNLMVVEGHNPGILDFQDAVSGPVTYDLVSLLRDCYIAWPRARVEDWVLGYRELALQSGILRPQQADEARFLRWFDLMGVQRHLKAAGIFARLKHRDGKAGYLKDIPRTLGYVAEVSGRYPALDSLGEIVERVLAAL